MLSKFSGWLFDFFPSKFAALSKLPCRNNHRFKVPYPRTSSQAEYAVDDKYGKLLNQINLIRLDLIPGFPVSFLTSSQANLLLCQSRQVEIIIVLKINVILKCLIQECSNVTTDQSACWTQTMHTVMIIAKTYACFCEHFPLYNFTRKSAYGLDQVAESLRDLPSTSAQFWNSLGFVGVSIFLGVTSQDQVQKG